MARGEYWSIGTDPEMFLRNKLTKELLPVCGLVGGTKENPRPMADMEAGFSVQEDNVMLEFNVPPATGAGGFASYVQMGLSHIYGTIGQTLNAEIVPQCGVVFPDSLLVARGATIFGCSPDFDGYNNGVKHEAISRESLREGAGEWRFAGGHIHLGYRDRGIPPFVAAQFADVYIGLPSVAWDKQGKRRTLYGKAGRYRPTKYGVEYRTLSNFWLFDQGLTQSIARKAGSLAAFLHDGRMEQIEKAHGEMPWPDVQRAINNEDQRLAGDLLAYFETCVQEGVR